MIKKIIILAAMSLSLSSFSQENLESVEAQENGEACWLGYRSAGSPVDNQAEADQVCKNVCLNVGGIWTGLWRTTGCQCRIC